MYCSAQHIRQRSEQREYDPDEGYYNISVLTRHITPCSAADICKQSTCSRHCTHRPKKALDHRLVIIERDRDTCQHEGCFNEKQESENSEYCFRMEHYLKNFSSFFNTCSRQNIITWSPTWIIVLPVTFMPLPLRMSPPILAPAGSPRSLTGLRVI